ncbi:MAG: polyprenyl synthetase family protein [Planctomycetes bacterium]|nr:polyprenyl synthetase family protein [Planctomycetota bacterium]
MSANSPHTNPAIVKDASDAARASRERELRALVAPIAEELELSSVELNRELSGTELSSTSAAVLEISAHARRYRGKRLRAAVVLLAGRACGSLTSSHVKIAAIVEMIHMATLVHDDVLDHADTRRRVPTVNSRFGNNVAVLLGDWTYARAFALSTKLEEQACSRILAEITATVCRGEIEQSRARLDFTISEDRYIEMIDAKTASLYAASAELGALYAGANESVVTKARDYGRALGLAFQIVDDCLDLDGSEEVVGKSLGTDVSEGKITLPIIYMMRDSNDAQRARIREIFTIAKQFQDETNGELLTPEAHAKSAANAQKLLAPEFRLREGLEASYALADRYIHSAVESLQSLPACPARNCLQSMAEYILHRRW